MRIGIVLSGCKRKPGGGAKIIYQYANFMANKKHEVILYFNMSYSSLKKIDKMKKMQQFIASILVYMRPSWFELDDKIKKRAILSVNNNTIEDADIIIATAIETAKPVAALNKNKGNKFYFIQDFENWNCPDEEVLQSYGLGMVNITVSKWLSKIVDEQGNKKAICISNGIDTDIFYVRNSIKNRPVHSITMQYRSEEHKGCKYAFETIRILEKKYSDLKVTLFGREKKPDDLPDSCKYIRGVDQKQVAEINNSSRLFLCSSIKEGFGLPGLEAMACGCVLVATEYEGVFEYAQDRVNALISPIKDAEKMAENIILLFENEDLRLELAKNAIETGFEKSYIKSAEKFEKTLFCVEKIIIK